METEFSLHDPTTGTYWILLFVQNVADIRAEFHLHNVVPNDILAWFA